ncbi:MAG TPA: HWE histidine kinase domain-containing protein [Rhizomicrobium sp.]|nr:HWE histidine kinase domain-containing protein [Rhizomicrobium sp.]
MPSRLFRPAAGSWRLPTGDLHWWQSTALALCAAAISFLLHWEAEPFFQPDRGLILFIPAIVLVTLIAGPRYGIVTAALSGVAMWYVTLPPVNDFSLSHADSISLCTYVFSSAFVILLVYWLRESRAQERLLRNELQHRTKNLFALVHGLAQQTLRGDSPMELARDAFLARLSALGRANETMGESGLDRVDLDFLVRSVLKSFSDRFACRGTEAQVNAQTARNLSLALHELATNSAKYGALTSPRGKVEVVWEPAGSAGYLTFVWLETGGPQVSPPTRTGFGSKLLKSLFNSGEVEFARDGLVYRVEIPLAA